MNAILGSRKRLIAAIAVAALVLGIATTLILAATGAFRGPATAGQIPGNGQVPGPTTGPGPGSASCTAPALPGQVVKVDATDKGAGMPGGPYGHSPYDHGPMGGGPYDHGPRGGGPGGWYPMGTMSLTADPNTVHAGTVSLRVLNTGSLTHEVVVLPLPAGQQPGQRPMGTDGRIDEAGSLGEASHTCGPGEGDGIAPGATGWTTLTLQPGRYELVCNIPGHYAAGMHTELDVTGQ